MDAWLYYIRMPDVQYSGAPETFSGSDGPGILECEQVFTVKSWTSLPDLGGLHAY